MRFKRSVIYRRSFLLIIRVRIGIIDISFRRVARYGSPSADQIIFNRYYIVGYSYYFRQAKWALEIVDPSHILVPRDEKSIRLDNFRTDYRIPESYRVDLNDYKGSGLDRGHLVASADQNEILLQNSETFLLSNMCPQCPGLNREIWARLENSIRALNKRSDIFEIYVICGPIFDFSTPTILLGKGQVTIPVPDRFFKSVLVERSTGEIDIWSFIIPNRDDVAHDSLDKYVVETTKVERMAGTPLWSHLTGTSIQNKKDSKPALWF